MDGLLLIPAGNMGKPLNGCPEEQQKVRPHQHLSSLLTFAWIVILPILGVTRSMHSGLEGEESMKSLALFFYSVAKVVGQMY